MRRLTLDEVRALLPDVEELRPILDDLLSRSDPDGSRTWAGSGELGTAGSRLLPEGDVDEAIAELARVESRHIASVYARIADALKAAASEDAPAAARAYLEVSASEENRDRPERAAAWADAAFRSVEGERDRTLAALALRRSARARRATGSFEEALRLYRRSHELALGMSDRRGAAEAAIGAGNVLEEQGRWDEAESCYHSALDALAPLEDPTPERWHALINLHIVARSKGELEASTPLLREAEEAATSCEGDAAIPFIENARGQLLMAKGAFEEAEDHFRAAIAAAAGARARVQIRLNLAECFLARGRLLDAAEHARECERDAIRSRVTPKLPEVYRLLGRIAAAEGNPDAFVLFERSLDIAKERTPGSLEEALTLQAYAAAESGRGEAEAARQLREDARKIFERLGITRERQRWADVYGPASENQSTAQDGT